MQGRVAVSHAFALGTIEPRLFEEIADGLARAEVAIMTSCPPAAPVPPLKALRERGVTVFGSWPFVNARFISKRKNRGS